MSERWVPTQKGAHLAGRKKAGTEPELALRRAIHALGGRFRVNRMLAKACTPDIVLPGRQVVVFVDGCFWHGCPVCFVAPGSNKDYWESKMLRNRQRDEQVTASLIAAGWTVIRLWEHEVEADAASCAANVASVVARRRTS